MPTALDIAEPRVLSDATRVLADPAAYGDRPTLIHLARLATMSAQGTPLRQAIRPANSATAPRPGLA